MSSEPRWSQDLLQALAADQLARLWVWHWGPGKGWLVSNPLLLFGPQAKELGYYRVARTRPEIDHAASWTALQVKPANGALYWTTVLTNVVPCRWSGSPDDLARLRARIVWATEDEAINGQNMIRSYLRAVSGQVGT